MGVTGLMKYINEYRNREQIAPIVNLVTQAEEVCAKDPTGAGKALLLCDYSAVVRVLENVLLEKRQPRLCGYYGCNTKLLGEQIELFVKFLRSVNIEPVFVGDGPTGADEESFKAKFAENKKRQVQKLECSVEWEKAVKLGGKVNLICLIHYATQCVILSCGILKWNISFLVAKPMQY